MLLIEQRGQELLWLFIEHLQKGIRTKDNGILYMRRYFLLLPATFGSILQNRSPKVMRKAWFW